ncbi:MAG: hypothetical protein JXB48_22055 [Candidatus Latescibacteria bacterium]|nr:hypothetical protein [Candidatus Latescibacterota bacterium]
MFKVGDVFIWDNFPYKHDPNSEIKKRYFIYLGKTKAFVDPVYLYIVTGTTQKQYYNKDGTRKQHLTMVIPARNYGFPEDTIIDLTFGFFENLTEGQMISHKHDIVVIGQLPEDRLRQLYNLILKETHITKKIKFDIHNSFNLAGISGLKKPK